MELLRSIFRSRHRPPPYTGVVIEATRKADFRSGMLHHALVWHHADCGFPEAWDLVPARPVTSTLNCGQSRALSRTSSMIAPYAYRLASDVTDPPALSRSSGAFSPRVFVCHH